MFKKMLVGAFCVAIVSGLLFGTEAVSYLTTSCERVSDSVQSSVPIEFQIDRARKMVRDLEPEIRRSMHVIAEEETEVAELDKRIEIALTYIYGVGATRAKQILKETGIDPDVRVKNLSDSDTGILIQAVNKIGKIEGDLRREVAFSIRRLMEIGSYRGLRHRRGLPVRGQRTRTNARTRKGRKKTVGSGRKAAPKK